MLHCLLTAAARLFVKLLPTHSGPIAAPISVSNNTYHQTLLMPEVKKKSDIFRSPIEGDRISGMFVHSEPMYDSNLSLGAFKGG